MGTQAYRRVRLPSLGDPCRRVALVSALVSTLAVVLTYFLLFPFFLSLVLSPLPSFLSLLFPHFLLPHYLVPCTPLTHYMYASICKTCTSRTFFDNKMAIIDLLTPYFGSYKIILILLFLLVNLIFYFIFYISMYYLFSISFR